MDCSYGKPYIYLSFNFWKQYSANETCLIGEYAEKCQLAPSDVFERVKFSVTYTEIPRRVKLFLTAKIINYHGMVTHVSH